MINRSSTRMKGSYYQTAGELSHSEVADLLNRAQHSLDDTHATSDSQPFFGLVSLGLAYRAIQYPRQQSASWAVFSTRKFHRNATAALYHMEVEMSQEIAVFEIDITRWNTARKQFEGVVDGRTCFFLLRGCTGGVSAYAHAQQPSSLYSWTCFLWGEEETAALQQGPVKVRAVILTPEQRHVRRITERDSSGLVAVLTELIQ